MSVRRHLFDISPVRHAKKARTEFSLIEQLEDAGLPLPDEEYPFASVIGRNWKFDFAWPAYRLALEIEGALFGGRVINVQAGFEYRTIRGEKVHIDIEPGTVFRLGGGHNTGERLRRDLEKRQHAAMFGWAVLPIMPEQVKDGSAVGFVKQALQQRGWRAQ
jgi:hypothetical protein